MAVQGEMREGGVVVTRVGPACRSSGGRLGARRLTSSSHQLVSPARLRVTQHGPPRSSTLDLGHSSERR
ncbi:MAG: hypothetical protein WDW36_000761 [Sanguina aurantia]